MDSTKIKMGRTEWGMLLLLSALWGSSFLFMKIATQELPVFTVAFGRIGIAAAVMLLLLAARRQPLPTNAKQWGQLLLLGFLQAALPITLFVWASTRIDSNVSGILNSATPIFTAIIAHFLTQDERLSMQRVSGIGLGVVGIIFLVGPSALQGLGDNVLAQLAVLAATCSYGFAAVYGRRFKTEPVAVTTASFLLCAAVVIAPLAFFEQPWTLRPNALPVAAVFAVAIFNTAFAFMVWLALTLRAGANNTSQVTFLIPLVAILLGFLVLGERPGWNVLIGLCLILGGLAITQGRTPTTLRAAFQRSA